MKEYALIGCILGSAVGDALGLPYEGMTGERGKRLFPDAGRYHFLFGRGMVSDDTEHACFVAQAIIRSQADPDRFEKALSWSLRWWLLGLPAGIGFATLRSIIRLWSGIPPARSGVLSAGNGPAMRSPVLGVAFGDTPAKLREYVHRSTRMTHSDPKAHLGALTAAVAAYISASGRVVEPQEFPRILEGYLSGPGADECLQFMRGACDSAASAERTASFAANTGSRNGLSGYIYHTVPCVIQTWLRRQTDFAGGVREIIEAGGDTDTAAAILGGIIGAGVGKDGIPLDLLQGIVEWPRSMVWMEDLGQELGMSLKGEKNVRPPQYAVPGLVLRNTLFTVVVLAHGLRRLLPPYR